MEKLELPVHSHPLYFSARFCRDWCKGCEGRGYLYGGYICNKVECNAMFHKDCVESLPEINHSSHPKHPLKLKLTSETTCGLCGLNFTNSGVYYCSICDFTLDLGCTKRPLPPHVLDHSNVHEHPLLFFDNTKESIFIHVCSICNKPCFKGRHVYGCDLCKVFYHMNCVEFFPEVYHISHPKHPLRYLKCGLIDYTIGDCVLCGEKLQQQFHHCDVCNFSICTLCVEIPPPVGVLCLRTHEHQLHIVPRIIDFTCNVCGTRGDRSPYFCLQCNFMIHRDCIDLPRVININRHDHRVSYKSYLGFGNWNCGVCRQKVDGCYGAYMCSICSSYVVHSRCAIRNDVWDKIELEGIPEEIDIAPFEVINGNTIKHFSHDHNLVLNKDGLNLPAEITVCKACVFPIYLDPAYICEQCDFILHETCANLSRKKRHMCHNQQFTLQTQSLREPLNCFLCWEKFTGFYYKSGSYILDIRCSSISEPFTHRSHQHFLYYTKKASKKCDTCDVKWYRDKLSCDDCVFNLEFRCDNLPLMVMKKRYDDHPLFLSYGENNVAGEYWCDICKTKVDPKKWFYTCDPCGVTLHVSCIVGDISYIIPGQYGSSKGSCEVVTNTSNCRPLCSRCHFRCMFPFVIRFFNVGIDYYFCSLRCFFH